MRQVVALSAEGAIGKRLYDDPLEWLNWKETRKNGPVWLYRFYVTREKDSKRVERNVVLGPVKDYPSTSAAWGRVVKLQLQQRVNQPHSLGVQVTFGILAEKWREHELGDQSIKLKPRSATTIRTYEMYLRRHILPRWQDVIVTDIKALAVEQWLQALKRDYSLANPTCYRLRQIMSLVFGWGRKHELIPDNCNPMSKVDCDGTSNYTALVIKQHEAYRIWSLLKPPENILILLVAITALRMSEALGLKWRDIDWDEGLLSVRRSWTMAQEGKPKSRASKAAVPCIGMLAEYLKRWRTESPYNGPDDWVFASLARRGAIPRSGGILVTDHLHKAAEQAGVLKPGEKVRFGLHNLRHSLVTFLISQGTDPKTVQSLVRHSNAVTTLQTYAQAVNENQRDAQQAVIDAFFAPVSEPVQ